MSELKINSLMRTFLYLNSELYFINISVESVSIENLAKDIIVPQMTTRGERTSYKLIIVGPHLNTCLCVLVLLSLVS